MSITHSADGILLKYKARSSAVTPEKMSKVPWIVDLGLGLQVRQHSGRGAIAGIYVLVVDQRRSAASLHLLEPVGAGRRRQLMQCRKGQRASW